MGNTNCGCSRKVGGKRVKMEVCHVTKQENISIQKRRESQRVKKEDALLWM